MDRVTFTETRRKSGRAGASWDLHSSASYHFEIVNGQFADFARFRLGVQDACSFGKVPRCRGLARPLVARKGPAIL